MIFQISISLDLFKYNSIYYITLIVIQRGYELNNLISKEISFENSPEPNQIWINLSEQERIKLISNILVKNPVYGSFEITRAEKNGYVILRTEKSIKASERGVLLLELEQIIKNTIDQGITIWLEPVGDKSKLRNLRGIEIKSEK